MKKYAVLFISFALVAACSKGDSLPWHTKAGKQTLELVHAKGPTVMIEAENEHDTQAESLVVTLKDNGYVFGEVTQPACTVSVTSGYNLSCVDGRKRTGISHPAGVMRELAEFQAKK